MGDANPNHVETKTTTEKDRAKVAKSYVDLCSASFFLGTVNMSSMINARPALIDIAVTSQGSSRVLLKSQMHNDRCCLAVGF